VLGLLLPSGENPFMASTPALRPTQPPLQGVPGAVSPDIKRPGREADLLSPSSFEVNVGAIPPLPHISSCRGAELIKHRSNFILILLSAGLI
jgi:hypothetical protein